MSGARPNEALVWRQFFAGKGAHPLPGRAAGCTLSRLGAAEEHGLLRDKLRTGELLAAAGLPVPRLLHIVRPREAINLDDRVWAEPGTVFAKPRWGSAGRGALAVEVICPGDYRLNGGPAAGADELRDWFARTTRDDDVLVQPCLRAADSTADLAATGAAPVLRVTTARRPGEAPFLHSALLSVDVPGERARDFIRGQIRVPIEGATGIMRSGIWFLDAERRHPQLPWNGAPIAGRLVPDFARATEIALHAMALLPGLPLANWDVILTNSGPVILEGNTGGDWILTNLSAIDGPPTEPLAPLLRQWAGESAD